jgi:chromosome partitioning protein
VRSFLKNLDLIHEINKELEVIGFVFTKYDRRKKMTQEIKRSLLSEFGKDTVFNTPIRTNIALAKAREKGMDIFTYDRKSNGAIDYNNLTKEFLSRVSHLNKGR